MFQHLPIRARPSPTHYRWTSSIDEALEQSRRDEPLPLTIYSPFFTPEEAQRFDFCWSTRRMELFAKLKDLFLNLTTMTLYTPMIMEYRRQLPLQTIERKTKKYDWTTYCQLFELYALTQQTDLIFVTITDRLAYKFGSTRLELCVKAIKYLWSINVPYSHSVVAFQLKRLIQDYDWQRQVTFLQQLYQPYRLTHFFAVDICENLIYSLLRANAKTLYSSARYNAFYQTVYLRSSKSLRLVLAHNFGRPLCAQKDQQQTALKTYRRRFDNSSLAASTFYHLYQYFEYRGVLIRYKMHIFAPLEAMRLLYKMINTKHGNEREVYLTLSSNLRYFLDQRDEQDIILRLAPLPDRYYDLCHISPFNSCTLFEQ